MKSIVYALFSAVLVAGLSVPAFATVLAAPGTEDYRPPKIETQTPVNYPYLLRARSIEGFARVVVVVDQQGRPADVVVYDASHPQFGMALARSVREWTFQPALVEGEAAQSRVILRSDFSLRGTVTNMTTTEFLMNMLDRFTNPDFYRLSRFDELDRLPERTKEVAPVFPEEARGMDLTGEVMVHFVIDPDGKVRVPGIRRAEDELLAAVALQAIQEWEFTPPTRKGRPVYAHGVQPFTFK
ncbi:MAG: TonB family protein [Puniceicoccaceae bacterium]|nr:MAG: TonB family protein [Puniceicoccaceae bacterium]